MRDVSDGGPAHSRDRALQPLPCEATAEHSLSEQEGRSGPVRSGFKFEGLVIFALVRPVTGALQALEVCQERRFHRGAIAL